MKLKLTADGTAVVQDGKPIYIDDNGAEIPFDAPAAMAKITDLNKENQGRRLKEKELGERLTSFEGIDDPSAAIKALQFAASMEGKKAMDDESIQKLIANAIKPLQDKSTAYEQALADKDNHIYKLEVSNKFASSQFIKDKLILPPDIVQATFGSAFKIENGRVMAYDAHGNQIFSRVKPGEPAEFEEALSTLIDQYPAKDAIYKASGASGSGAQGNNGNGAGKSMALPEFNALSPAKRAAFMSSGGTLTD